MKRRGVMALVVIMAAMAAEPAFAQAAGTAGLQVIDNVAKAIADFMTGAFAKTAGTIAVAALGYMALRGHVRLGTALSVIAGLALIFGAAQVVTWLSSASGGAG